VFLYLYIHAGYIIVPAVVSLYVNKPNPFEFNLQYGCDVYKVGIVKTCSSSYSSLSSVDMQLKLTFLMQQSGCILLSY